jgi:hypothetical protein
MNAEEEDTKRYVKAMQDTMKTFAIILGGEEDELERFEGMPKRLDGLKQETKQCTKKR